MKYMMLIADSERQAARSGDEAVAAYQAIEAWWDAHAQAGRIVEGHELEPASTATTVHIGPDGDATITDGPFAEGKEVVGGYAILDVADLDEALTLASSWPTHGTLEIRPLVQRE